MKLITLKAKEIKEKIALKLGESLSKDGFKFKKTDNQFACSNRDNVFIFNMLLSTWSDHYSIEVRLYICQKEVENIYENIVGKGHGLTMGNTIQRIYKSPDGKQVINGNLAILLIYDEDIDAAIETLETYYRTIAVPYFSKYSNLANIDDIMNNPPFNHSPAHVGGRFDDRCMKGLIIARLVNNPSYERLVMIYDEAIKETMDAKSIENYYKVREYLMYNRIK